MSIIFAKEFGTITKLENSHWLCDHRIKKKKTRMALHGWDEFFRIHFACVCCFSVARCFVFERGTRWRLPAGSRWFTARRSRTRRGIQFACTSENKINSYTRSRWKFSSGRNSSRAESSRTWRASLLFLAVIGRKTLGRTYARRFIVPLRIHFISAPLNEIYICIYGERERKNYILRDFPGSVDVRKTLCDLDI